MGRGDVKPRSEKDPNAPKRPLSAFFIFSGEQRSKIKAEFPDLSIGDVAKKLGKKWAEQTPADRKPFELKAAKLKEKYEKDVAAYRAKGKGDAGKKAPRKPAKKAEPEEDDEDEEDDENDE